MGIRQLQQMQEQSAIQQQQAQFAQELQPLERQKLEAGIAAQRANTAQLMASRDVTLEGLRQSKQTFAEQEEIKKQGKLLNEDVMAVVKDPTLATQERLRDISFRTALFLPKSYEPFQRMFEELPRAGKVLENTASDVIFAVQSGQPKVAVASVNKQLEAAQNSLQINPDDNEAKAAVSLLNGVKSQMDEEKYGEAMVAASIFLKNQNPRKWNAVTGDLQELGKATKAVAEAAGEKTKSELQEAQARLARADAALKEIDEQGGAKSDRVIKQENLMRSAFSADPVVRNYESADRNWNIIQNAENSVAGDRSRIVAFIKLQQPDSVVSVTESGQIEAPTASQKARAFMKRLANDGLLGDPARKELQSQAGSIYNASEFSFKKLKANTEKMASGYGINPKNVTGLFEVSEAKREELASGQSAEEARIRAMLRPAAGFGNTMTPSQMPPQGSTFQGRPIDVDAILKQYLPR
jgi:hypothetical protein